MSSSASSPTQIVIVDDDEGHAILVRENLAAAGVSNDIRHFPDGQTALDFFFGRGAGPRAAAGEAYLVILDIRMPKVDGIEVLRRLKTDAGLHKLPVIMLTTTDDTREVERCFDLGCNVYLQKPVDYDRFAETIQRLGAFIGMVLIPTLSPA